MLLLVFSGCLKALDKQTILDVQKPAPCINYPSGTFEGICSFNAFNHVMAAGVKKLTEEYPHHTIDFGHYSKILDNYFKVAFENRTARLDADDLLLITKPTRESIQIQPIGKDVITDANKMHRFIKNITLENVHEKPVLYFNITNNQPNGSFYTGALDVPQYIEIDDQNGQKNNYVLVAVLNEHNYVLLESAFFQLRKALALIFRVFKYNKINLRPNKNITVPSLINFIPSKSITNYFNKAWDCHVDAFVNYNNIWYLMDDTTRWKAAAKSTTTESISPNPDLALHALLRNYPGTPNGLVYAPMSNTTPIATAVGQNELLLIRDTPRMSFAQSSAILLSCFVLDTCFIGGVQFILGQNPLTALKVGSIFGMLSYIYHSRHMAPLRKSRLNFTNTKHQLGPRAPVI